MLGHVPAGTHMCLIYSSKQEVEQDLAEFLSQCVRDRGIAHYFYANQEPESVLSNVGCCGCDDTDIRQHLKLHTTSEVYTPDRRFDKSRTLTTLVGTYNMIVGLVQAVSTIPARWSGSWIWKAGRRKNS